ncbi:MAG: rod shape-determining protein MreC [Candidatus Paceibacterota bacterium]|jgi:cell shape-determining protein MreC
MKTTYLQNRNQPHWYKSWTFTLVAFALALIFSPARTYASQFVIFLVSPFTYAGQFIVRSVDSLSVGLKSKENLMTENEALRTDIELSRERLSYLSVLTSENNELKNLLSRRKDTVFSSTTPWTLCAPTANSIGALVLLSPERSYYASMLIDVGSTDGISRGDKVYSFGDIVLGSVSDVYTSSSRVILYSAAKVTTSVFLGEEHVSVNIQGDGDGTFIASLPKNIKINVLDEATLPTEKPTLVARVEQVKKTEDAPFETIYLKSPVNLHTLKWVYVDRKDSNNIKRTCIPATR